MPARTAVDLVVVGRVQGVGFRAYAEREATALGLAGWVRNEPDGTVVAHAEGWPTRSTPSCGGGVTTAAVGAGRARRRPPGRGRRRDVVPSPPLSRPGSHRSAPSGRRQPGGGRGVAQARARPPQLRAWSPRWCGSARRTSSGPGGRISSRTRRRRAPDRGRAPVRRRTRRLEVGEPPPQWLTWTWPMSRRGRDDPRQPVRDAAELVRPAVVEVAEVEVLCGSTAPARAAACCLRRGREDPLVVLPDDPLGRDAVRAHLAGRPPSSPLARPLGCGGRQHRHDGPADGLPWEDVPLGEGRRGQASVGTDGLLDPGVDPAADSGMAPLCQTRVAPSVGGPKRSSAWASRHRLHHPHHRARPRRRRCSPGSGRATSSRPASRLARVGLGAPPDSAEWHMLYRFADDDSSATWEASPSVGGGWAGAGVGGGRASSAVPASRAGWTPVARDVEDLRPSPPAPPRWEAGLRDLPGVSIRSACARQLGRRPHDPGAPAALRVLCVVS